MYNYSYKKNKLDQLKGFCAVVECGTIVEAAKKLHISESSISLQISSLEQDLKVKLFDKIGRNLKVNKTGRVYYIKAKDILNKVGEIYNEELILKVSRFEIWKLKIENKFDNINIYLAKHFRKVFLKLTFRGLFIAMTILFISLLSYMNKANYFFDKELERLANPLLKEVMKNGYYRISADKFCPFEGQQMSMDMYDMLLRMDKKYKDITIVSFLLSNCPMVITRFTGNQNIDKVFNNLEHIGCNTEKVYKGGLKMFQDMISLLDKNKNFRVYNLYYEQLEKALHYNFFLENINKYPDQLFGIEVKKPFGIPNIRFWLIKYNTYYYISSIANIVLNIANPGTEERYIFWKKLTLDELMHYDNGSYWKLIKEYNIKID
jgi:hypothetical protein